ncbi:MAG: hypothetical protein ACI4A5_06745, partial [Hominilimicola sp.]
REENYFVMAPLSVNIRTDDSADVTKILTTSNKAYVKTNTESMDTIEKTDADVSGECTVGAVSTIGEGDKESKLLLISASQFLTQKTDQIVAGGNGDLFLNALNWMSGREDGIAIHAKSMSNERLTVSDGVSGVLGFVSIFLIPAAVVGIGIYVLLKRKKR